MTDCRNLSGLLVVNKPSGMVSKDVGRHVERLLRKASIGHVGTLDPIAEGVLPLLLGRATRLQDYLLDFPKEYVFDVLLGEETSTLDKDGPVVSRAEWQHVQDQDLVAACQSLTGRIEQTPPAYSAVKYMGKPLYYYARRNLSADVPTQSIKRKVEVYSFVMLERQGALCRFRVRCARGTYVRSLVKDVTARVGTCGTVVKLVRTEASGIKLDQAVELGELGSREEVLTRLLPLEAINPGILRFHAKDASWQGRLTSGRSLLLDPAYWRDAADSSQLGVSLADVFSAGAQRPMYLYNSDGKVFGLGIASERMNGQVQVKLTRGLA